MRNFLIGYGAGVLTYHYISGGFKNDELVSEMRGLIKKLDDRLAEAEKAQTPSEAPPTAPTAGNTTSTFIPTEETPS